MSSPKSLQSSAGKNEDQLSIRDDKIVLIEFFCCCWKIPVHQRRDHMNRDLLEAAVLPKNFFGGFLQSSIFPEVAVMPTLPLLSFSLGTRYISVKVPWFWTPNSEM